MERARRAWLAGELIRRTADSAAIEMVREFGAGAVIPTVRARQCGMTGSQSCVVVPEHATSWPRPPTIRGLTLSAASVLLLSEGEHAEHHGVNPSAPRGEDVDPALEAESVTPR